MELFGPDYYSAGLFKRDRVRLRQQAHPSSVVNLQPGIFGLGYGSVRCFAYTLCIAESSL